MGEPVRDAGVHRAQAQGRGVRIPAGSGGEEERAAAQIQPRVQEDARAPPRRPPRLRVPRHPAVRRRGLSWLLHPPAGPLPPRRPPVLGRVRRRQAPYGASDDERHGTWRRQGRRRGAGVRRAPAGRGGPRGVQRRETLLRGGRRRLPGHRRWLLHRVVRGRREDRGAARPRRGDHAAAGCLGVAVLRARGRQGPHARRRQARRVRRGAPRGAGRGGQGFLPAVRRRGFLSRNLVGLTCLADPHIKPQNKHSLKVSNAFSFDLAGENPGTFFL